MKYTFKALPLAAFALAATLLSSPSQAITDANPVNITRGELLCNVQGYTGSGGLIASFAYILNGVTIFSNNNFPLAVGTLPAAVCPRLAQTMCQVVHEHVDLGIPLGIAGDISFPFNINVRAYTASAGVPNSRFTHVCN